MGHQQRTLRGQTWWEGQLPSRDKGWDTAEAWAEVPAGIESQAEEMEKETRRKESSHRVGGRDAWGPRGLLGRSEVKAALSMLR